MRDLVVISHLRWDWVWQRPQHLISRLAEGRRTWFVEEPREADVDRPVLVTQDVGPVARVWLAVPQGSAPAGYEPRWVSSYLEQLPAVVGDTGGIVWLYTALGVEIAAALDPEVAVYDVMDDLSAFKGASPSLALQHLQALRWADLVFTGGRSLQRSVLQHRAEDTYLFASGVEPAHWEKARSGRRRRGRPVAGYVGVIDERLDLDLVGRLAQELPEWDLHMVGPVTKIDPADLPWAANLHWLGQRSYDELPEVLRSFDVALMPFALNESTRSISPTKTLEYLAAGLPVVSTRVPDVVDEFESIVDLRDDAPGFAAGCREVLDHDLRDRDRKLEPLLAKRDWDRIATRMLALIEDVRAAKATEPAAPRRTAGRSEVSA
ncbi:MAG: glycosyltransferase family 1 protein [Acidimicrobiales bacterium]|nr:glycosyltransferase family 1 protein [Acidimicrobiales bacterium]